MSVPKANSLNNDLSIGEKFSVQESKPCIVFLNGEYWYDTYLLEKYTTVIC